LSMSLFWNSIEIRWIGLQYAIRMGRLCSQNSKSKVS
jgi:hypothetical protein